MKARLAWPLAAVLTLGGCTRTPSAGVNDAQRATAPARSPLAGSWRLVWLELPGADGALRRISDARGSLIYTPTGQVSVQVMYASADAVASAGPVQYVQAGYEGTFGQYVVDESTRTVTHRYEGANVRSLLGQDLPRRYEITGNRLVLRSTRADEHWSVVWERDGLAVR